MPHPFSKIKKNQMEFNQTTLKKLNDRIEF